MHMSGECDFCHAADPPWIYPATDFTMPQVDWGSKGSWAACNVCSDLIEHGETVQLVERSIATSGQVERFEATYGPMTRSERKVVFDQTSELHRRFRLNRKGPRRLARDCTCPCAGCARLPFPEHCNGPRCV